MTPGHVLLQLDATAAFNTISRHAALEEAAARAPCMVSAFATWLCRPSRAIFVQADGTVAHLCTHVGIEQGCPASPAAYALAARRATDLSLAHLHEAGYPTARAFAYMDDTSVILPAGGADVALQVAEVAFAAVGLALNPGKCTLFVPPHAALPLGPAHDLWLAAARKDGVQVCGAPMSAGRGAMVEGGSLMDAMWAAPLGEDAYVASFLDEHLLRLQRCLRRVSLLPSRVAERAPDCQVAALLLRHCGTSRAQHLLRALPPRLTRAFAVRADELLREAFVIALGLPGLDAPQQLQLTLPTAYGGMGVTPLEATAEAAYLGAAAQVHEAAGGGGAGMADGRCTHH